MAVRHLGGLEVANEDRPFGPQGREGGRIAEMLLNVTVQQVALGPLHFDDREPGGANLNALLEKLKIDVIGQVHLAKMFGDRLITFGMVADPTPEAANGPRLLD